MQYPIKALQVKRFKIELSHLQKMNANGTIPTEYAAVGCKQSYHTADRRIPILCTPAAEASAGTWSRPARPEVLRLSEHLVFTPTRNVTRLPARQSSQRSL